MDKLDLLIKQIRSEGKYENASQWVKAVDAYKKKHGTTKGFSEGRLEYTDPKGKTWRYAHGAHGGGGRARSAEATNRFLKNRADAVKANRLSQKDYTDAFGEKTGSELYQENRKKLNTIKKTGKNNPGFDADHIRPASKGGAELPKSYRMQNTKANRSEQARPITKAQRQALRIDGDKHQQLRTQGPKVTPRMRQNIMSGKLPVKAFRLSTPLTTYGSAIDEITGGHVDRFIKQRVNDFRGLLGLPANPL